MTDLKFEIIEQMGVFSDPGDRWKKELNIVRWNDGSAKYDLRAWNESHNKMSRGITLSLYELRNLKELLNSLDI